MKLYVNCITSGAGLRRDIKELIPEMNLRRRMSRVVKSGVAAGIESLLEFGDRAAVEAVVTATGLGCIADSEKFLDSLIANEERMLNPTPFIQSTFNTVGAQIALLDGDTYLNAAAPAPASARVFSHASSDQEFARLQPDKTDMTTPALEDAARAAATQIFSLRRHRIELVTGEAGENVFGEGLKAALEEIDRMEQSYLELFLGKRVVSTETRRYVVYPQSDKKQYIVCRFSAAAGLLPESDLSGDMVLLQIEPSGNTATAVEASAKESNTVACRVADPSVCTVIAGGREYARAVLPLFEFGRTINVALPRRK